MTPPREWQWLALVTAVAFVLRAHAIGLTHFNIDEATACLIANRIAHLNYFPLTGLRTSFGFHNPPLFFYVLAPFFAITRDPRLAMMAFAAAGAAVPWLLWRATRSAGGTPVAAITAAVIAAMAPNAVEHSRRLWGHDTIVFLGALSLCLAMEAYRRRSGRWLAGSFAAATAAQAMHLSGALLWLAPAVILFSLEKKEKWIAAGGGALALAVVYTPWVANEFIEGFPGLAAIRGELAGGAAARDLGLAVTPAAAWVMVLGDFWNFDLLGHARPWEVSSRAAFGGILLSLSAGVLLAMGLVYTSLRLRAGEDRVLAAALLLSMLAPFVVFALLFRASVPPYFLPAFPAAAVGASLALGRIETPRLATVRTALLAVYTLSAVTMIAEVRAALARGEASRSPLREKMEIARTIRELAGEGTLHVFQNTRSTSAGVDYAYVYLFYREDLSHRFPTDPRGAGSAFVLVEDHVFLRPEPAAFLRRRESIEFPNATLYLLRANDTSAWMALLEGKGALSPEF